MKSMPDEGMPNNDTCPLCGTTLERHLPDHLPCDGVADDGTPDPTDAPREDAGWRDALARETEQLTIDDLTD